MNGCLRTKPTVHTTSYLNLTMYGPTNSTTTHAHNTKTSQKWCRPKTEALLLEGHFTYATHCVTYTKPFSRREKRFFLYNERCNRNSKTWPNGFLYGSSNMATRTFAANAYHLTLSRESYSLTIYHASLALENKSQAKTGQ